MYAIWGLCHVCYRGAVSCVLYGGCVMYAIWGFCRLCYKGLCHVCYKLESSRSVPQYIKIVLYITILIPQRAVKTELLLINCL